MTTLSFKISLAVEKIKAGKIIAYPTEAVYGLGCDPLNKQAVIRLLTIKNRPVRKGLILIASSLSQLEPYLQLNNKIRTKVKTTWPGAVTWIIPAQFWVPKWLIGRHSSLAVRVTSHPLARLLCQKMCGPLVSTSANKNSKLPATNTWKVMKNFRASGVFMLAGKLGNLKQATPIYAIDNYQQIR